MVLNSQATVENVYSFANLLSFPDNPLEPPVNSTVDPWGKAEKLLEH
jgi:hypothetical protein